MGKIENYTAVHKWKFSWWHRPSIFTTCNWRCAWPCNRCKQINNGEINRDTPNNRAFGCILRIVWTQNHTHFDADLDWFFFGMRSLVCLLAFTRSQIVYIQSDFNQFNATIDAVYNLIRVSFEFLLVFFCTDHYIVDESGSRFFFLFHPSCDSFFSFNGNYSQWKAMFIIPFQ